jgi:hypothetical protein
MNMNVPHSAEIAAPTQAPFKICTVCGAVWHTRDDFLGNPGISIVGYQVHFQALTSGLFLFNHSCQGTLSIKAELFTDLYKGPAFSKRKTGSKECPGHCLHKTDLAPCPVKCECAFVREIIQHIINYPKQVK